MSLTFTKLFSSITESTIWSEPDHVRILWITMLAMADKYGRVWGSVPGLANRARLNVPQTEDALERFQQPDKYSRTPDNEGRRIEVIDGGWRLLNHSKYRQIRDEEVIKESKRRYINARRAKEREAKRLGITTVDGKVEKVERGRPNADTDTDADADADAEAVPSPTPTAPFKGADVVAAWNDAGLTQCKSLTEGRRKKLAARLKSPFFVQHWRAALDIIANSDFCRGGGNRGWKADFDWFVRSDDVVAKAIEGQYGKRVTATSTRNGHEITSAMEAR